MNKYSNKVTKMVVSQVINMWENNVISDNGCEGFVGWCEDGDVFEGTDAEIEQATALMKEVADKVDELTYNAFNTDGYGSNKGIDKNLIDKNGDPYLEDDSFPAGGGLDKRCDYNGDALYCYYQLRNRDTITNYLKAQGWGDPIHSDEHIEIWEKGNTKIYFEEYDFQWAYVHTEFVG